MNEFLSIVYLSGRLLDEHDYSEEKSFQNMDYMLIKLSDVPAKKRKSMNRWIRQITNSFLRHSFFFLSLHLLLLLYRRFQWVHIADKVLKSEQFHPHFTQQSAHFLTFYHTPSARFLSIFNITHFFYLFNEWRTTYRMAVYHQHVPWSTFFNSKLYTERITLTVFPSQASVTSHSASRCSKDVKTPVKLAGWLFQRKQKNCWSIELWFPV